MKRLAYLTLVYTPAQWMAVKQGLSHEIKVEEHLIIAATQTKFCSDNKMGRQSPDRSN